MRPHVLLLICLPCVLAAYGCVEDAPAGRPEAAEPDAFSQFTAYVGRDLRELDDDSVEMRGLLSAIERLVPARKYESHFGYWPWHVWQVATAGGDPAYLLFETERLIPHPGSTPIRLTVFGPSGQVLSETEFDTAHRCYLRDVELQQGGGELPLVVLKTAYPFVDGGNRQYYAIIGDRFDLIRLEKRDGAVERNVYDSVHFAAGPPVPIRTEAEWVADLLSEDRLRTLRTLVWLGGVHRVFKEGDELRPDREDPGQVTVVRQVRKNPAVLARLRELSQSKDAWLSEAASLALNPEDRDH
jgi:hypothetical protein